MTPEQMEEESSYWATLGADDDGGHRHQLGEGADGEVHRGQLRIAYRLAYANAGRLRYVHGIGWHVWDGARWSRDLDGQATRAAVTVVRAAYGDLPKLDRDASRELLADIHRCESASGVDGVLRLAGDLKPLAVSVDGLDADPYLLNCANGTLDLRTGALRAHDPADMLTKVTGCGYYPGTVSDTFTEFLAGILPDQDMRAFTGRVFGHALVGRVIEHVLPIFTGTGQNGKSTLVDTVAAAFGDYCIAAEPDLLVERGAVHTTGQADLLGVRLAVCSETDEGRRLAAATVKRLTGGDKIRARRMRMDNIEFEASHSVLMVTNHKPKVSGDDPALWRRLRIVPFDVVVAEPNKRLKERLALELPAVLAWVVTGYADWHRSGLAEPDAVTTATDAYKASSDELGRFIGDRCIEASRGQVKARELFTEWSNWCHQNGEQPGTEVGFAEQMSRRGFDKVKRRDGAHYQGLLLAGDDEETQ